MMEANLLKLQTKRKTLCLELPFQVSVKTVTKNHYSVNVAANLTDINKEKEKENYRDICLIRTMQRPWSRIWQLNLRTHRKDPVAL